MKKDAMQPWTQIAVSTQYKCISENRLLNILPLIWKVILSEKSEIFVYPLRVHNW